MSRDPQRRSPFQLAHVVFTGGGTAGHVIPALPLVDELVEQKVAVTYIGSTTGLEVGLLGDRSVRYLGIATGKLRRYFSWQNALDVFRVGQGIWQAWRMLSSRGQESGPVDVVFSKGGYVSLPVVVAAWLRRIPVVAHESDQSPGLANRLALRFIHTLCTNFRLPHVSGFRGRLVHTGTPVRAALLRGDAARGKRFLKLESSPRPLLVVTGGSLGAVALNEAVRAALPQLLEHFDVVHVCGRGKADSAVQESGYQQYEFMADAWGDVLAAADLVLSRAGANTLCELLLLRKPHLLVPLSAAASRGDQLENAAYSKAQGFSDVLLEEHTSPAVLVNAVNEAYASRAIRVAQMQNFEVRDPVASILGVLRAAGGSA